MPDASRAQRLTFPSLAPVFALDRFYLRGLRCTSMMVPRGMVWARMSDHLPLVAELEPASRSLEQVYLQLTQAPGGRERAA